LSEFDEAVTQIAIPHGPVPVSVPACNVTEIEDILFTLSMALKVTGNAALLVGVPERRPVPLRDRPVGSVPVFVQV
jgi:hypothetical protein